MAWYDKPILELSEADWDDLYLFVMKATGLSRQEVENLTIPDVRLIAVQYIETNGKKVTLA